MATPARVVTPELLYDDIRHSLERLSEMLRMTVENPKTRPDFWPATDVLFTGVRHELNFASKKIAQLEEAVKA
jgi:hypothetical protein